MTDPITSAVSDRICQHMNEDHPEAVLLYSRFFGHNHDAETASMVSIDPQGMNLSVVVKGEIVSQRIEFDHHLQDSEDAHQTLIGMVRQARNAG
jgi:putative heme iron utilization protein